MSLSAKLAACAVLALAVSCRDGTRSPSPSARRYTVRGEVTWVSPPGARGVELSIRHEPIPDFADRSGAVVGMPAMVMPFPVAPGVSLAGIEAGDKVRFRFAMDWEGHRAQIEALEELPKETRLEFEAR